MGWEREEEEEEDASEDEGEWMSMVCWADAWRRGRR